MSWLVIVKTLNADSKDLRSNPILLVLAEKAIHQDLTDNSKFIIEYEN